VADGTLDITENTEGLPGFGDVAERLLALDGAFDFGAGVVVTAKLDELYSDVAPVDALISQITVSSIDFRALSIEADGLLGAPRPGTEIPELGECHGLVTSVVNPHPDPQRVLVGLFGRIKLPRIRVDHPDLVPCSGGGGRLVEALKYFLHFPVEREGLRAVLLTTTNIGELAFAGGNRPGIVELLIGSDRLLVCRSRFVVAP
jgi:hypothetical protein